jgi:hypothetical protein
VIIIQQFYKNLTKFLRKSYNIFSRLNINASDIFRMLQVVSLALLGLAVDDNHCSHEVDELSGLGDEQVGPILGSIIPVDPIKNKITWCKCYKTCFLGHIRWR